MAAFSVSTALLDAVVLACVAQGPTAMNSPTKSKACSQSQSPHSIPFCGDCKKTNTYKPMTSPIKGETAGITTSPMPDGRLWKPTAPSGSSTNNKLTNF